ncbi:hypothetical protein [Nannocystis exedens]|uniref:hypothetical protein n=1 Tax=Nannocystis exedens TaxID=54 RepID=UPI00116057D8|nr:hypothetical protein [Nannocystis exedens]
MTSSNESEVKVISATSAVFTASNWNDPQRFQLQGVDDEVEDGDIPVQITVEVAGSADPAYLAVGDVTLNVINYDDDETLTFSSPFVECVGPSTEDIHDGSVVGLIYDQAAAMSDPPYPVYDPLNPWLDDRVHSETSDQMYIELRTLHVILQDTFADYMTISESLALRQHYARAVHRIHTTSRGMVRLNFDQFVLSTPFGLSSFADASPDPKMQAEFTDFDRLTAELAGAGYDIDEYDMISVSVAWHDTDDIVRAGVANAVWPGPDIGLQPFTNPTTWNNDLTLTTRQYVNDPLSGKWRDIFIHEIFHNMEWMLEYGAFVELRNPDDPWWMDTYPDEQTVLNMFWARPKTSAFWIPEPWGKIYTQEPTHIAEMTCPEIDTYVERKVYCPAGVDCGIGCWCNP